MDLGVPPIDKPHTHNGATTKPRVRVAARKPSPLPVLAARLGISLGQETFQPSRLARLQTVLPGITSCRRGRYLDLTLVPNMVRLMGPATGADLRQFAFARHSENSDEFSGRSNHRVKR